MAENSKTDLLKAHQEELVKVYQELDNEGRPKKIYTAHTFAKHGDRCTVMELIYQGPASTVVKGRKEGISAWDATWVPDSAFTISE